MLNKLSLALAVLSLSVALVSAGYSCAKPCYGNMCCSIPSDNSYYLTDFCGSTSACGPIPSCTGGQYFTADSQRFGCGKYLNVCRGSKCIKSAVIDAGPAMWVEQDAGRAIIDGSPQLCKELFGVNSCGWSDHFSITALVAGADDLRPVGPFNVTEADMIQLTKIHEEELIKCGLSR
ncbi:lysozyme [Tieghemostelium lacteum]|uniref:Lysozyme n=1 Tax=Tieghemostelium lacteum TaxID=361077 RepID=A0A151ZFP4_TIELA|nr:lysozyme [Tieghemostelium lacteum]|eukprot:KYQ92788.1 lysozyme [Tieghemostelium lacteum]